MKIKTNKVDYKCIKCSSHVLVDAWVIWDVKTQGYEIHKVFDSTYCETCDETNPEVEEIIISEDEKKKESKTEQKSS